MVINYIDELASKITSVRKISNKKLFGSLNESSSFASPTWEIKLHKIWIESRDTLLNRHNKVSILLDILLEIVQF